MHNHTNTSKRLSVRHTAFTLVEMLIVIVIIGILASALIPKLQGLQGKARDTARKADLNQIGTAMSVFYLDNGSYPKTTNGSCGNTSDLEAGADSLVPNYMSSVPKDPDSSRIVEKVQCGSDANGAAGSYRYTSIKKNNQDDLSYVILAMTEEGGSSSNYIHSGNTNITTGTDFATLKGNICTTTKIVSGTPTNKCHVKSDSTKDLRFIYIN